MENWNIIEKKENNDNDLLIIISKIYNSLENNNKKIESIYKELTIFNSKIDELNKNYENINSELKKFKNNFDVLEEKYDSFSELMLENIESVRENTSAAGRSRTFNEIWRTYPNFYSNSFQARYNTIKNRSRSNSESVEDINSPIITRKESDVKINENDEDNLNENNTDNYNVEEVD